MWLLPVDSPDRKGDKEQKDLGYCNFNRHLGNCLHRGGRWVQLGNAFKFLYPRDETHNWTCHHCRVHNFRRSFDLLVYTVPNRPGLCQQAKGFHLSPLKDYGKHFASGLRVHLMRELEAREDSALQLLQQVRAGFRPPLHIHQQLCWVPQPQVLHALPVLFFDLHVCTHRSCRLRFDCANLWPEPPKQRSYSASQKDINHLDCQQRFPRTCCLTLWPNPRPSDV